MDPALALETELVSQNRGRFELMQRGDSDIQQFYKDAVIFITGGSGFIGKQLIEKLFRSCKIKKIYMLLRTKKQKTVDQRLQEMILEQVYDVLRESQPNFGDKIEAVVGDISELRLGLSDEVWNKLTEEVNFIIHSAATVNFAEPLHFATMINVRGTREMLEFGKACRKLRSYVHVSTAYSHGTKSRVGQPVLEQFYPSPIPPTTLIEFAENLNKNVLESITPRLIDGWPNTYTFTKAVAEEAVRTMAGDLPICIVRPAIAVVVQWRVSFFFFFYPCLPCRRRWFDPRPGQLVPMSFSEFMYDLQHHWLIGEGKHREEAYMLQFRVIAAHQEPTLGWLDKTNILGPSGLIVGLGLGVLHLVNASPSAYVDLVPVDFVNNAIIAAAHETVLRRERGEADIQIYTVADARNRLDIATITGYLHSLSDYLVSDKVLWYTFAYAVNNKTLHYLLFWFFHYIPAYIIDGVFFILGKKRIAVKLYDKTFKMGDVFFYFLSNSWKFEDDNLMEMYENMSPTDRAIYQYDMATVNWKQYINIFSLGIRKYILKDGLNNTAYGLQKLKVLRVLHYLVTTLYVYSLYKIVYLTFWMFSWVVSLIF